MEFIQLSSFLYPETLITSANVACVCLNVPSTDRQRTGPNLREVVLGDLFRVGASEARARVSRGGACVSAGDEVKDN